MCEESMEWSLEWNLNSSLNWSLVGIGVDYVVELGGTDRTEFTKESKHLYA